MVEEYKTIVSNEGKLDLSLSGRVQGIMPVGLASYQAPFLMDRLLDRGIFNSEAAYAAHFDEFKKYVDVVKTFNRPTAMISEAVDEVWHDLILFTREYAAFCEEHVGKFLHHSPNTEGNPVDKSSVGNFFDGYSQLYGSMPEHVWGKGTNVLCGAGCNGNMEAKIEALCGAGCNGSIDALCGAGCNGNIETEGGPDSIDKAIWSNGI